MGDVDKGTEGGGLEEEPTIYWGTRDSSRSGEGKREDEDRGEAESEGEDQRGRVKRVREEERVCFLNNK